MINANEIQRNMPEISAAEKALISAKNYMAGRRKADWNIYEHFKRMGAGGEWIDDYDGFIAELTSILGL